jgi:hypothetical protein
MSTLITYTLSLCFIVMKVRKEGWTGSVICRMGNVYKIFFKLSEWKGSVERCFHRCGYSIVIDLDLEVVRFEDGNCI